MGYILSIDQGTTGTTAFIINAKTFQVIDKSNQEFRQIYPKPGRVEHDLEDIWSSVETTVNSAIQKSGINPNDLECIGITNQRETTCAFSKKSGKPLSNAIVWQDRRTNELCNKLKQKNLAPFIKKATGLTLDPYFSATKMQWMLENCAAVKEANAKNDLYFGTIDTYLLYRLTGNISFKTEVSNASRTLLMNLETGNWDQELLQTFKINKILLPAICDSFYCFGETKNLNFLPDGIKISGILGDQQSALFGQAAINKGDMKCTYGTGAFMLLNTGNKIVYSDAGLLTTAAFSYKGKICYALEGSSYIAGAAVQWLRDNLCIIDNAKESEELAEQVTDLDEMKHLLFLPFFTGIGSPYWESEAKATITGITRDTNKSHLTRACLEGICLSINDLIQAFEKDTGKRISTLKVDGGAVSNNLLMKIQASISNIEIVRPNIIETTAFGAAIAAAVGIGSITFDEIKSFTSLDCSFNKVEEWSDYYSLKTNQWSSTIRKLYL